MSIEKQAGVLVNLPTEYTNFWLAQSKLFVGLVVALILSNLAVMAALLYVAHTLKHKS